MAAAVAASLLVAACSSSKRRHSRLPIAVANPDESASADEIARLSAKIDEFEDALAEPDYEEADECLDELEDMLEDATPAVINHPDYNRISTASRRGRERIRRMRRQEASTAFLERVKTTLEATERLLADIEEHGPTESWLESLEENVDELQDLRSEGEEQADDSEWAELAPRIDRATATAADNEGRYAWWLELRGELDRPLEQAVEAEQAASNAEPTRAIDANDKAAQGYERCLEVLGEAKSKWGYDPDRTLGSPFGPMRLEELMHVCRARAEAARSQVAHLRWKREVTALAGRVTAAVKAVGTKKRASEVLQANENAADVLADCMNALRDADEAPGYDAETLFLTHAGKKTALGLHQTCLETRRNLIDLQPTLRWRIGVTKLRAFVEEVRSETKAAIAEKQLDDKVEELIELSTRFDECSQRSGALATRKHPWSDANPSRAEIKAMVSLQKACRKEHEYVGGLLKKAQTSTRSATQKSTKKRKKRKPKK